MIDTFTLDGKGLRLAFLRRHAFNDLPDADSNVRHSYRNRCLKQAAIYVVAWSKGKGLLLIDWPRLA